MGVRRVSPTALVMAGALVTLLVFAAWGAWASWRLAGDAKMSIHGWIAMALAGGLTALLTAGLMGLAFYSARKGYDDNQSPDP